MFAGVNGKCQAMEGKAAIAFDEDVLEFEESWWLGQKKRVAGALISELVFGDQDFGLIGCGKRWRQHADDGDLDALEEDYVADGVGGHGIKTIREAGMGNHANGGVGVVFARFEEAAQEGLEAGGLLKERGRDEGGVDLLRHAIVDHHLADGFE